MIPETKNLLENYICTTLTNNNYIVEKNSIEEIVQDIIDSYVNSIRLDRSMPLNTENKTTYPQLYVLKTLVKLNILTIVYVSCSNDAISSNDTVYRQYKPNLENKELLAILKKLNSEKYHSTSNLSSVEILAQTTFGLNILNSI